MRRSEKSERIEHTTLGPNKSQQERTLPLGPYVIYQIPYFRALQWFLSGLVVSVILGVVAALIYKPATAAG